MDTAIARRNLETTQPLPAALQPDAVIPQAKPLPSVDVYTGPKIMGGAALVQLSTLAIANTLNFVMFHKDLPETYHRVILTVSSALLVGAAAACAYLKLTGRRR